MFLLRLKLVAMETTLATQGEGQQVARAEMVQMRQQVTEAWDKAAGLHNTVQENRLVPLNGQFPNFQS